MLRSLPQLSLVHSAFARTVPWTAIERVWSRLPQWKPVFGGWGLYTAVCFLVFLVTTFPSDMLIQRVVWSLTHETPTRVQYESGKLSWLGMLTFHGLEVEDLTLPKVAPIRFTTLALQPSLLGLLSGQPFPLDVQATLYGGTLSALVKGESEIAGARFDLRQLALERIPFPEPWGHGRLIGRLSTEGKFEGDVNQLHTLQGELGLEISDGELQAGTLNGFRLPALNDVSLRGEVSLTNSQLKLHALALNTSGAEAHLSGSITLRQPIERSLLHLQLVAEKTGSPPPALVTLIAMMPASKTSPDKRQMSIAGTLARPNAQ